MAPALATQQHAIVSRRKAPSPGAAGMQQELESSIASRQLPSRSPMVGARPACTAFCCFSSLEKNFWAWLRICTAVFVLTWSDRQGQWDRGWGSAVSSGNGEPEALCGAPAPCACCACWPSPPRTLYLAPLPAVEPQRLHKALVLLIGPPLPLLGDGVGLAGLHERGGRAAVRRLISAAAGQIGTLNGGSWLVAGAVGCVMEGCESWEGGWARAGRGGREALGATSAWRRGRRRTAAARGILRDCWRRRPPTANRRQLRLQAIKRGGRAGQACLLLGEARVACVVLGARRVRRPASYCP